jgi:hydroxymethylpyrimidine pyrophosphatase-like HAD family hydrolase
MLQVAGLGVAMKNSNPKVLEIADKVTTSNDEDGIAIALETIFGEV